MRKSSRILGQNYGLTAQEMNQLLKNQGYLDGDPGCYRPTEKGLPYVTENDYHSPRSTWSERTWDDSILKDLDLSSKSCRRARNDVAKRREERHSDMATPLSNLPVLANSSEEISGSPDSNEQLSSLAIVAITAGTIALIGAAVQGIKYLAKRHEMKEDSANEPRRKGK